MRTIEIMYSCRLCQIKKRKLQVEARGEQDVLVWMEATTLKIAADHRQQSPGCMATHIDEIWIPSGPAVPVGVNPPVVKN